MARRMWQRGPDGEIVRVPPAPAPPPAAPDPAVAPGSPGRARLGLALRLGARDTYDHLGALILLSVIWTLLMAAILAAGQSVGQILSGALPARLGVLVNLAVAGAALVGMGGPVTAGVYRYTRNAAARREPELFDLAWGFRGGVRAALCLGALQATIALVLAGNCYFYLLQQLPVLVVVGAIFGYFLLFWLLASLYQWPLLAEQELSALAAVKKSALLVLDNLPYTLGLGLIISLLTAICWATVIGGVLLWIGVSAMLCTQATRELLRKYRVLGPDPTLDPIADETSD